MPEADVDPWRALAAVSDEALAVVRALRPLMQRSAADGRQDRVRTVYDRAGRACPRCGSGSRIRLGGQGDDNRTTYWCPSCQS